MSTNEFSEGTGTSICLKLRKVPKKCQLKWNYLMTCAFGLGSISIHQLQMCCPYSFSMNLSIKSIYNLPIITNNKNAVNTSRRNKINFLEIDKILLFINRFEMKKNSLCGFKFKTIPHFEYWPPKVFN